MQVSEEGSESDRAPMKDQGLRAPPPAHSLHKNSPNTLTDHSKERGSECGREKFRHRVHRPGNSQGAQHRVSSSRTVRTYKSELLEIAIAADQIPTQTHHTPFGTWNQDSVAGQQR